VNREKGLPATRAAASVVFALACSAAASIQPLPVWFRPRDVQSKETPMDVESNTEAQRRGVDRGVRHATDSEPEPEHRLVFVYGGPGLK
jgi:hypothetical protein